MHTHAQIHNHDIHITFRIILLSLPVMKQNGVGFSILLSKSLELQNSLCRALTPINTSTDGIVAAMVWYRTKMEGY